LNIVGCSSSIAEKKSMASLLPCFKRLAADGGGEAPSWLVLEKETLAEVASFSFG
jgi:hypothetical protein